MCIFCAGQIIFSYPIAGKADYSSCIHGIRMRMEEYTNTVCVESVSYTHLDVYKRQAGNHPLSRSAST